MNSDRNIASRDTIIVRSANGNGSKGGSPDTALEFKNIQIVNQTAWTTMNHVWPATAAIASPTLADIERRAKWSLSSSEICFMFCRVVETVRMLVSGKNLTAMVPADSLKAGDYYQ